MTQIVKDLVTIPIKPNFEELPRNAGDDDPRMGVCSS